MRCCIAALLQRRRHVRQPPLPRAGLGPGWRGQLIWHPSLVIWDRADVADVPVSVDAEVHRELTGHECGAGRRAVGLTGVEVREERAISG